MSELGTMSDFMEYRWLTSIALERLRAMILELENLLALPHPRKQHGFLTAMQHQLRAVPFYDPYCVCFSGDGDVLSQWRAYADDGRGFAIGFDSAKIRGPKTEPLKVCYDLDEQNRIVNELIEKYLARFSDTKDSFKQRVLASEFHAELLGQSQNQKNPMFSEEQEWRIIHEPQAVNTAAGETDLAAGYRIRGSEILRYLQLPFQESALIEVVLGPKNPAKSNHERLETFLKDHGFAYSTIGESRASYR
ncbi:MAG TPA: DUF2971 domain-containing protein [Gemmataceae bacterium]|nr:DUF2971 domain-containing protein [Gemmataceae bacterium]